jgi:hypothetical protein
MKMTVVSTIALRYCYCEDGDRFYGIPSLEDHSVNLHHHESVIWGFSDKMEIREWHWVHKVFPECVGVLNMCEIYCYFK